MKKKNYLKNIIAALGFDRFKATPELLDKLGMTPHRLNQILDNTGRLEITVLEKEGIENWLLEITGEKVDIFDDGSIDLIAKHHFIKP